MRFVSKKAFAYLRVSSRGQVEGNGFERQEETIRAYAHRAGLDIVGTPYRDVHTGAEAERPAFAEMVGALNGVRVVIVESLDRLARDLMVQTALLTRLRELGVTLIAATTGEDVTAGLSEDPMREAMVQIQGVFAQLDKKLLVRKLRKAREAMRVREGRCEGRKPFGAREDERETLEVILTLRRARRGHERMSFENIAKRLNAEGRATRTGKPWVPATIYGIVRAHSPRLTSRG